MRRLTAPSLLAIAMLAYSAPASAATAFAAIASSPDVTVALAGTTVNDEDVAEDDFVTPIPTNGPPGIPASADLEAYHRLGRGELFSLDTTAALPGGLTAEARDVVRWDGANYTLEFDGSTNGVPNGASIDAVSIEDATGDLILSFDLTIDFSGLTVEDEDLVAFDGLDYSLFFDGSAAGLSQSLDLDAVHHIDENGNLALSFDTSGDVAGVAFDDEDVLEYEWTSGGWELVFDGSTKHAAWSQADLDALHLVPEPNVGLGCAVAVTLLAAVRRRRMLRM